MIPYGVLGIFLCGKTDSLVSLKEVFLTRILIADDRQLMRDALKAIFALRPTWKVCGEASDGAEAVAKAVQLQPDLVILDFKMPLADGIRAASEILTAMPSTPIVMYTLYKTEELESAAKLVGVRAVVGKEDGVRNLLSAVDAELAAK
ncbi:MAG TPA: response regulator transcription factor [Candidatus Acidoferrum sp.]|nr:response regulator transcription factor [Candidatus Acidoferrum sp.]